ncbi:isochorismatase family protein [Saccharothrix australiensis]|uniref:Bifunctional isochorismate lyase/aryl carrier protein n=1 Tax=Saccharothrix australiensis TaxID=2072 RepID=A0A495W380_9PSEU|nr:isochorismatase family protein [Saccharothrix australiensis]RKT55143.1 bifunctional isochorismate lyase/aryl carrier protein [Saccharothrix australiensis]
MAIPPIEPYPMPGPDELPAAVPPWVVRPRRAALLIHDMQRYFLAPFQADRSPAVDLVRNIALLRDRCRALGVPIAYTAQPGGMTERQRGLLKDFWGPGMTIAPEQRTVVAGLEPAAGDRVFTKWRYSAFHRSDLLAHLRRHGRDQLVLCGVFAHVGVLTTAVDAYSHDIETFVVADAVADFSAEHHRLALSQAARLCAVTPTTAAVLEDLAVRAADAVP